MNTKAIMNTCLSLIPSEYDGIQEPILDIVKKVSEDPVLLADFKKIMSKFYFKNKVMVDEAIKEKTGALGTFILMVLSTLLEDK